MHRDRRPKLVILALIVVLLPLAIHSACTSSGSYGVLSFLFDGVPVPGAEAQPAEEAVPPLMVNGPVPLVTEQMTVHRPYSEGKCDKCHASRAGKPVGISSVFQGVPVLIVPSEQLCLKCHAIESKRFLHAPAISGQCIFCHDPHRSPNKRMLLMSSTRDLCARCHKGSTFLTERAHDQYGKRECIECHDPHAADLEFGLLPGVRNGEPQARKPTVSLPKEW